MNVEEYLFNLSGRCESIFIAGGAAVDMDLCGDIDLWFGGNRTELAEKFLGKFPVRFKGNSEGYPHASEWKVVGSGYDPMLGKIVQVMVTNATTPLEAMESFDISTHKWALTSRGMVCKGHNATLTNEPPQILHWTNKTFERYVKICRRYGHPVDITLLQQYHDASLGIEIKPLKKKHKLEYNHFPTATKGIKLKDIEAVTMKSYEEAIAAMWKPSPLEEYLLQKKFTGFVDAINVETPTPKK